LNERGRQLQFHAKEFNMVTIKVAVGIPTLDTMAEEQFPFPTGSASTVPPAPAVGSGSSLLRGLAERILAPLGARSGSAVIVHFFMSPHKYLDPAIDFCRPSKKARPEDKIAQNCPGVKHQYPVCFWAALFVNISGILFVINVETFRFTDRSPCNQGGRAMRKNILIASTVIVAFVLAFSGNSWAERLRDGHRDRSQGSQHRRLENPGVHGPGWKNNRSFQHKSRHYRPVYRIKPKYHRWHQQHPAFRRHPAKRFRFHRGHLRPVAKEVNHYYGGLESYPGPEEEYHLSASVSQPVFSFFGGVRKTD
jgi:hypothetical protein